MCWLPDDVIIRVAPNCPAPASRRRKGRQDESSALVLLLGPSGPAWPGDTQGHDDARMASSPRQRASAERAKEGPALQPSASSQLWTHPRMYLRTNHNAPNVPANQSRRPTPPRGASSNTSKTRDGLSPATGFFFSLGGQTRKHEARRGKEWGRTPLSRRDGTGFSLGGTRALVMANPGLSLAGVGGVAPAKPGAPALLWLRCAR